MLLLLFWLALGVLSLCSFFCPWLSALFNGVCLSGFHPSQFLEISRTFDFAKKKIKKKIQQLLEKNSRIIAKAENYSKKNSNYCQNDKGTTIYSGLFVKLARECNNLVVHLTRRPFFGVSRNQISNPENISSSSSEM